jgi:hypothetical protein
MKKNEDSPVVQRVREARRKLTEDAGGDFEAYWKNLLRCQEERLAAKSRFRPHSRPHVKKARRNR